MAENLFLASLPAAERGRLAPALKPVYLKRGTTVLSPGKPVPYVYFPVTALSSIIITTASGSSVESSAVGCEGPTGMPEVLSEGISYDLGEIQVAGEALRMNADRFRDEYQCAGPFRERILQYISYLSSQMRRSVLCNWVHTIEERMAKWLLISADGIQSSEIAITQEYLSIMLGVHRPIVTGAAGALREAGSIDYAREDHHYRPAQAGVLLLRVLPRPARPPPPLPRRSRPNGGTLTPVNVHPWAFARAWRSQRG